MKWFPSKSENSSQNQVSSTLLELTYEYRFDLFALVIIVSTIFFYTESLLKPGQIVFSDIDFPFKSTSYLDEVFGVWNIKWNTTAMLNIPRLPILIPSFLLSKLFADSGGVFLKLFLIQNLVTAAFSFYLFVKRLSSIYNGPEFNVSRIFAVTMGSLYYALNPWVIFRVQHIYLLVGYAFFPMTLLLFFKVFDHKFQNAVIQGYDPFRTKLYKENYRDIILLAYVITLSAAAIHYFFYTFFTLSFLVALLCLYYLFKHLKQGSQRLKAVMIVILKKGLILTLFLILLSFFWMFVYFGSIVFKAQASQNNVNVVDTYVAFSRHSDIKSILYLISYWWPMFDMTQIPSSFFIGGGVILLTSAIGGVYHSKRRPIILLIVFLTLFLVIFSSGVYYVRFAKLFLRITNLPIIGSLFRDPNKLLGLLAICIGTCFVFGLESLLKLVKYRMDMRYVIISLIFGIMGFSVFFYLHPMKYLYFEKFYEPIEQPKAYSELATFYDQDSNLDSNQDHYAVYLPIADEMGRPGVHVSTPYWNATEEKQTGIKKATGDVHIYNSKVPTLFQFEGNNPAISYYYQYLQYLMDEGRSHSISYFLAPFGIDQFIYHDEYLSQSSRQKFNLEVILKDSDLEQIYENDIFHVFQLPKTFENRVATDSLPVQSLKTPYGFERTALYEKIPGFDLLKQPILYLNQNREEHEQRTESSFVEVREKNDYILTQMPESSMLYPFDWINLGNPFLGWSKTFMSSVDWNWFLRSQSFGDRSFDFDNSKGIAVTFASNKLDIEPYLRSQIKGALYVDFDTMLRTESFFVSDNPSMFEINSNPYKDFDTVQTIQGELIKGDPKDIWQVAKSGLLEAKGGTPYFIELLISGREVDQLHLKVRFFDADENEIGVSYIVSAENAADFDTINFTGEVISPRNTAYMRLDLLTFQNPLFKSRWWIHDVNIYDLSEYVASNTLKGSYDIPLDAEYKIWMRLFKSTKGGVLKFTIGGTEKEIDTRSATYNSWEWVDLGQFALDKGQKTVEIVGLDGFNAVNAICVASVSEYEECLSKCEAILADSTVLITFESSLDMNYTGHQQSERLYPSLSLGKGIALEKGRITGQFDILKEGTYDFSPALMFTDSVLGQGTFKLMKEGIVLTSWPLTKRKSALYDTQVVSYKAGADDHHYKFIDYESRYAYLLDETLEYHLEEGAYEFEIEIQSEAKLLTSEESLHLFDPSEIVVVENDDTEYEVNRSICSEITPEMSRIDKSSDGVMISYDSNCSYDWYNYSTPKIEVHPFEEILIEYDARSNHFRQRHCKVIFIDEQDRIVGVKFINEIEAQKMKDWHHYEQIVEVPLEAKEMLIQFLGRGDQYLDGTLEIKNMAVYDFSEFMLLDHLIIAEKALEDKLLGNDAVVKSRQLSQFGVSYALDIANDQVYFLNTFLSPNKNWQYKGSSSTLILNGITQGFDNIRESDFDLTLMLMKGYGIGLILHVVTVLSLIAFMGVLTLKRFMKNKDS